MTERTTTEDRAVSIAPGAVLVLQFDDAATRVQALQPATSKSDGLLELPVGAGALAREVLRHAPPFPLEIEHAIEVVEEAIMPAAAHLPEQYQLFSNDPLLRSLAAEAGQLELRPLGGIDALTAWLGIEAVEQLFNRLVARSEGRPESQDGLAVDGPSAARLVIVREILHHWGVSGMYVTA